MSSNHPLPDAPASSAENPKEWQALQSRLAVLEAGQEGLQTEIKALRFLLERVIEHRQKSHGELVLILAGLVGKLPMNDIGFTVAKLVEHNAHVGEILTALIKGAVSESLPQPASLKLLEQSKQDLMAAVKPAVEELLRLEAPFEPELLPALIAQPELFFSPGMLRANRCFVKGQVPRERILREFGEAVLPLFTDTTTDPKLNPRPKAEDVLLSFKPDFEALAGASSGLSSDQRTALLSLHRKIQNSKTGAETAPAQKRAFARLSFIMELLHYYKNKNTEASEGLYAQRLPAMIELVVLSGAAERLDEKEIRSAEVLLAFILNQDQRQMVVNNIGKAGGLAKTLKFVLHFRMAALPQPGPQMQEFIKHLLPGQNQVPALSLLLRLIRPEMQQLFTQLVRSTDRLSRPEAETLSKSLRSELGLAVLEPETATPAAGPVKPQAWESVKELMASRADPTAIAAAIRDRLHHKYDADELKQSWLILIEGDVLTLIKTFCQIPYLPDGTTDAIARNVLETYVVRLTHEKYATTYNKVVNSLKNMVQANPGNAIPFNFVTLVKWVDPEAAKKLSAEAHIPAVQG